VNRYDVNDSGLTTPLDALQIVNAIGRNDGSSIFLDVLPLPADLPVYPDVSGDGVVSSLDALQVINELSRIISGQTGSGEWVQVPNPAESVASGSGVIASTSQSELLGVKDAPLVDESGDLNSSGIASKTSVFDEAASIQLDSIVDSLAADSASVRLNTEGESVDDWFSTL
jgi:hypothetical protein